MHASLQKVYVDSYSELRHKENHLRRPLPSLPKVIEIDPHQVSAKKYKLDVCAGVCRFVCVPVCVCVCVCAHMDSVCVCMCVCLRAYPSTHTTCRLKSLNIICSYYHKSVLINVCHMLSAGVDVHAKWVSRMVLNGNRSKWVQVSPFWSNVAGLFQVLRIKALKQPHRTHISVSSSAIFVEKHFCHI